VEEDICTPQGGSPSVTPTALDGVLWTPELIGAVTGGIIGGAIVLAVVTTLVIYFTRKAALTNQAHRNAALERQRSL